MKIYNETQTVELVKEQCDLTKGYFKESKKIVGVRPSLIEEIKNIDGSSTTTTYSTLNIYENILVYVPYTQKQLLNQEKTDLEMWFETEYREIFEKCTRKISMGLKMKDGSEPVIKLQELYVLAETNANRINEIEKILKTL